MVRERTTLDSGASVDRGLALARRRARNEGSAPGAAGFTIVELLVSLLILAMLITLLIVAMNKTLAFANKSAEHQTITALRTGVELFEQEFGFLPPMVKDNNTSRYPGYNVPGATNGPLDPNNNPVIVSTGDVQDLAFLRGDLVANAQDPDFRFSEYSLPYYLIGALGRNDEGDPIDGVEGPGFREPSRLGGFDDNGREFPAYVEPSRGATIVTIDSDDGRVELQDSEGVPYRYYRWEPGQASGSDIGKLVNLPEDYNVPDLVGDAGENVELRSARWAIVGAGPNGVFGDYTEGQGDWLGFLSQELGIPDDQPERILRIARQDNIVEVGQ